MLKNASAAVASVAATTPTAVATADPAAKDEQQPPAQQPSSSPLAIHIGDAELLPGGFMDMTAIFRSTNTGNGISTNFSNFPFTSVGGVNQVTGNLSETRFTAQNSRLSLQATSKVGSANLKGYVEVDFLGNTAQNVDITSHANTLRMRLYWAQYQQGKFEFLAGQSWSLMTPNRNGMSPMPGDLFYSQDVDTNYQMGLIWLRTPGFRFVAHTSDTVQFGFAIEDPEQYVGGGVVLPKGFPNNLVDTGAGSSAVGASSPVPNPYPDFIGKIAFDPKTGKTHQHIDAAFVVRGFKTYNPATDTSPTKTGTGGSINFVLEPITNVRLIATNFFSSGGGRYIANTGAPDFIVNPDYSMSNVKSWSGIYGAEITQKNTLFYGYYSIMKADQNTTLDADGKTPIGYGIPGSTAANRKVQETTFGITQTFFRDPKIGGLQLMFQYSYLTRAPYSVPANTPSSAKLNMVYVNVRYLLP